MIYSAFNLGNAKTHLKTLENCVHITVVYDSACGLNGHKNRKSITGILPVYFCNLRGIDNLNNPECADL